MQGVGVGQGLRPCGAARNAHFGFGMQVGSWQSLIKASVQPPSSQHRRPQRQRPARASAANDGEQRRRGSCRDCESQPGENRHGLDVLALQREQESDNLVITCQEHREGELF